MRDVLCVPLDEKTELVFAADCSGGIGLKQHDVVQVPYDVVGYYGARVALMELMSIGAIPKAFIMQNFASDDVWETLTAGIQQAMEELQLSLPIVGSSESNMPLMQSAVGFVVAGTVTIDRKKIGVTPGDACWAVIGEPLVGEAVMKRKHRVLPLALFRELLQLDGVYEMIPIGSKGIHHEWKLVCGDRPIHCSLPLHASAGPATCVLMSYDRKQERLLRSLAQTLFYPIVNKL
ncbi:ATPase [Anoxybacillus sp.]|uniref:ATPase n=1 Tax=Anoxybacillus sp. TaxID=1872573 RepID=UPI00260F49FD|nr:ATPase [uncultured Anoxybacillus sp.]